VGEAVISRSPSNALRIWPFWGGTPRRLGELADLARDDVERTYRESGREGLKRWLVSNALDTARDPHRTDTSELEELYWRAADRKRRLQRLRELEAPEILLTHTSRALDKALEALLVGAATGQARAILEGHTSQVNACALSADDSFIVSASDDQTLKVWDAASGEERATLRGHTGPVADCAVSPDASYIVSAGGVLVFGGALEGFDTTLRVWDTASFDQREELDLGFPPLACAVGPDGSFIVSGSHEGALEIRDALTLAKQGTLRGHDGPITGCAVSSDGALVVSASWDGTIAICDVALGSIVARLPIPSDPLCVAVHPQSRTVACGDEGGNVYVADLID
jgi:WD40 repeat protein